MHIDPETLLFSNIDEATATEMLSVAEGLVLYGIIPYPHPEWLTTWFEVAGFIESDRLLPLATVAPARILLSLLRRQSSV